MDQSSSSGSGRRRRIGGEEEDGGSSSGCGGSDDTHGSIGRRGRSRHSSLLRTSEQRPASARGSTSSSIYCTIPRSASGRAKAKEGGANADTRKAGNGAVPGSSVPSQSQAVAAATALLDSKNKPGRKERSVASVGTLANRSKSSSSRLHQKAAEEAKPVPKKETPAPTVVTRPRKKISQLDKEKSASTVVGKSGGKPSEATENGVSRPKTWPMRIIEQSKSSRSSPQLPTASTGGVSSNTGTPEKAGSVSSRVRISSSDSSRNSSPALRPKGVLRGAKTSRTFAPTRITKKPDGTQQQTSSPGSASQTQLAKDGTSSPRRVVGAKSVSSRPTPDSASSRASNSPVANLRRTSTAAGRAAQQAASVTPTPKRAAWSRTKASGPALVKQNSAGAAPSPPRTSTVRGGNEVASRKVAPGSKPRTPLVERSTRPYSPKATNGGSAPSSTGVKKKPGPVQGALIHSRNGSNVSLDKGKEETVAPSGVGERSGTFLKDEPTVLKRPENVE
ncbi:hypothetical protein J437_LFUL008650 [Ladona fulva]|uniref:Uncharacterized protein n=1 Tax=Ladona fulva TaxID=123851 RepID=A0A8K0K572_LADFU|nr:hypothetical protein J437_LFUL008650 [Ladona fulva]